MAKARKTAKGAAKKKWVKIAAPAMFNQQTVGETYVYDARTVIGKTMSINLMTLTRNPKKQGINVNLLVSGQHEDRLTTELVGFRIMPSVVKRMVRRGKEKIEDSFIVTTADRKRVKIKPIIVTGTKAKSSILRAIRKTARAFLAKEVAKTPYEKFAGDIVDHMLQRGMYETLVKIFPLSTCEIRWFTLLKDESKPAEAPKAEATEKKPEKETAEA